MPLLKKLLSYKNCRLLNNMDRATMNGKKYFTVQQYDINNKTNNGSISALPKIVNHQKLIINNHSDKKNNINSRDSDSKKIIISEIRVNESYEKAIEKLNRLLPNYAVIQKSVLNRNEDEYRHIDDTRKLLECIGITVDDLRRLKVIHVAGTKGKGSTCVLTEQLLKSLGLKTGFYSSPHMFKVTERIRINGEPISDDLFAKYFWKIYQPIMQGHTNQNETPEYFKFLTAMAFHIFLEENVDVAIIEGSTCVLTEQLLKSLGLKTGFYSSPHMFKVTERIRINGEPISDDLFAKYFWKIYQPIMQGHTNQNETPEYFKFLTAMAFHIFLEENVDVAIIEVGIGGKYDPTNLLPHTKTCGITSLGIEHTNLLGNTLAEIAWQKSGIIKDRSNVFTVEQVAECMDVIEDTARECKANLRIVPKFHEYKWNAPMILTDHSIQKLNASLAIQLAYNWIRNYKSTIPQHILDKVSFLFTTPKDQCPIDVPNEFINPLENCYWPGRCQILNLDNKKIYFDGAHTFESIKICIEWFQHCTRDNLNPKCLIFSGTGDREFDKLLKLLFDHLHWDLVYFSPNEPYAKEILNDSSRYASGGYQGKLDKCYELRQIWLNLSNKFKTTSNKGGDVMVMPCVSSIFEQLNEIYKNDKIDILVTGSLHLVGVTLKYLNKDKF